MSRIRIIKKNDEYSSEYEVGDIFEIQGTWYGGVHITGKSGVPVSLDKGEYQELDTEPEPETEGRSCSPSSPEGADPHFSEGRCPQQPPFSKYAHEFFHILPAPDSGAR